MWLSSSVLARGGEIVADCEGAKLATAERDTATNRRADSVDPAFKLHRPTRDRSSRVVISNVEIESKRILDDVIGRKLNGSSSGFRFFNQSSTVVMAMGCNPTPAEWYTD